MATPESNTLLALQLFNPVAEQFNAQNDARTNLLLKVALAAREEKLKRDLATQGYDKSIELANMQANREDARWSAQNQREDNRMQSLQTREDTRVDAADKKQLRAEIAKAYPAYAAEAARLGEEIKTREAFPETWEGLGNLQAELKRLEQKRVTRDQSAAADAVVGDLDDAMARRDALTKELADLQKPSPEEIKFARTRAVEAVREALDMGGIAGAPKASSQAATKGLAALASGNMKEAETLLGPGIRAQFESTVENALQAAPNFKARLQAVQLKSRELQDANNYLRSLSSDLRKASATSLPLATKLTERRSALQNLMMDSPAERQPRSLDQIFGKPPAPDASNPANPSMGGATAQPGIVSRGISGLMDIGRQLTAPSAPTPETYFNPNSLSFSTTPPAPIIDTPARDNNTRRNEAVGDWLRSVGYGVTNLLRPSNWQGDLNGMAYRPELGALPDQLQSRLNALTDQQSPTAQSLRNQLLALMAARGN